MDIDWVQVASNGLFLGMNSYLIVRLTTHMDKLTDKVVLHEKRHEISDRIGSKFYGVDYSSEAIAKNLQPFPMVHTRDFGAND